MREIAKSQHDIIEFCLEFKAFHRCWPGIKEICQALRVDYDSAFADVLDLEQDGHIWRNPWAEVEVIAVASVA